MNVLVIEDDQYKAKQLVNFLRDCFEISAVDVLLLFIRNEKDYVKQIRFYPARHVTSYL